MRVYILGAGKVGTALAKIIRKHGGTVTLRAGRKALPKKPLEADIVVLAVRDRFLTPMAAELAAGNLVPKRAVVVHVAGSLGAEALLPLRGVTAGIAQMHPMISFADAAKPPSLDRGNLRVSGDPVAVRRATLLGKKFLGMTPRELRGVDPVGYHGTAAFVANGAAALAALGVKLLEKAGVPSREAPRILGPLLRSVAENVETLGFPDALTGPVRRGESASVERHGALLAAAVPEVAQLYWALVAAQLPLSAALGEASPTELRKIQTLAEAGAEPRRPQRSAKNRR